jgi:hypothetical protein
MWEMLFPSEFPYSDSLESLKWMSLVGDAIVNANLRPTVRTDQKQVRECPSGYTALMERSWSADPAIRPSFIEITLALRRTLHVRSDSDSQKCQIALEHLFSLQSPSGITSITTHDSKLWMITSNGELVACDMLSGIMSSKLNLNAQDSTLSVSMKVSNKYALCSSTSLLWICNGSEHASVVCPTIAHEIDQTLSLQHVSGSLDAIWRTVEVDRRLFSIGTLRNKLALGEWSNSTNKDPLGMTRLAVLHQGILLANIVGFVVIAELGLLWLHSHSLILIVDVRQMTTIAIVDTECGHYGSLSSLHCISSMRQVWGLVQNGNMLLSWDWNGNFIRATKPPQLAHSGVYLPFFNAICLFDIKSTSLALWNVLSMFDINTSPKCMVETQLSSMSISSVSEMLLDDLVHNSEIFHDFSKLVENVQTSGAINFLRLVEQLRQNWDKSVAHILFDDYLSEFGILKGLSSHVPVHPDFSRHILHIIEQDVKNWLHVNVLIPHMKVNRHHFGGGGTDDSGIEECRGELFYVEALELLIVADHRLHFFHIGQSLEHRVILRRNFDRAKSVLEKELENHIRESRVAQEKLMPSPSQCSLADMDEKTKQGDTLIVRGRTNAFIRRAPVIPANPASTNDIPSDQNIKM